MLVFVTKEIGRKVVALSTQYQDLNHHNFNKRSNYTISSVKRIISTSTIACHLLPFPKALFYCHRMPQTRVFQAALAGEDGRNLMSTMVVCHMDTSTWNPSHIAFKQVHLTPSSTTSICHILLDTDVMWVSVV
ncbi:hypothetical protein MKW94_026791 [Papaver nudicaule]|uniref:BURP domain-containing protein n=1 Tax=Papaver nudicaule TaxID=74823 RepID=A0AA41SIP5_PAPNU|nr:hypothetical protein [Papaver nudicaule]